MGTEGTRKVIPPKEKKSPHDTSATAYTPSDLKIEEKENVVMVSENQQQQPLVFTPTNVEGSNSPTRQEHSSEHTSPPTKNEEEGEEDYPRSSLSAKAQRAEESVSDFLDALGTKAEAVVRKKLDELDKTLDHNYIDAVNDSSKIKELGLMTQELAEAFEGTMTTIEKMPYEEQMRLFRGYKKLLEEQIRVIDSRISMTKRLK